MRFSGFIRVGVVVDDSVAFRNYAEDLMNDNGERGVNIVPSIETARTGWKMD